MTATEEYFGEECPKCLTWAGDAVTVCPVCGYPIPLAYVLPYDDPPWEYSHELVATLRRYEGLRLMARYAGRSPDRLAELSQCRRLYLSRYKGFDFQFLSTVGGLESLELDFAPITHLDAVQYLRALSILKLTECRNLERIDALGEQRNLIFLSIALCNRIADYSPVGKLASLQSLFIEARTLQTTEFVSGLSNLRSLTLGVDKVDTLEPLYALDHLEQLTLRKKIAKARDVERLRARWPNATITID